MVKTYDEQIHAALISKKVKPGNKLEIILFGGSEFGYKKGNTTSLSVYLSKGGKKENEEGGSIVAYAVHGWNNCLDIASIQSIGEKGYQQSFKVYYEAIKGIKDLSGSKGRIVF